VGLSQVDFQTTESDGVTASGVTDVVSAYQLAAQRIDVPTFGASGCGVWVLYVDEFEGVMAEDA